LPAFDLVVLGDINPDVMISAGELAGAFGQREQIADTGRLVLGGSAVITAVAAARLGARVALVGCIGADWIGRALVEEITAQGVQCRVRTAPSAHGSRTMLVAVCTIVHFTTWCVQVDGMHGGGMHVRACRAPVDVRRRTGGAGRRRR
jgi:hypothetical protein